MNEAAISHTHSLKERYENKIRKIRHSILGTSIVVAVLGIIMIITTLIFNRLPSEAVFIGFGVGLLINLIAIAVSTVQARSLRLAMEAEEQTSTDDQETSQQISENVESD